METAKSDDKLKELFYGYTGRGVQNATDFHPVFRMKTGRKTLIKRKIHWKGGSGHGKNKKKEMDFP